MTSDQKDRKPYWSAEPAVADDGPPPMSGAGIFFADIMVAVLVIAALFFTALHSVGGLEHGEAVRLRIITVVICLLGTGAYGISAVSLSRADRTTAAGWQGLLCVVGVIFTLVMCASAYQGPYMDSPAPGRPGPAAPASPTSARMICYSGGGCSVDGTPVPGSP